MSSRVHSTHLDALGLLDHVAIMQPKRKHTSGSAAASVSAYTDPRTPGSLGSMERYVRTRAHAERSFRGITGSIGLYVALVRRRFPTLPVLVFHINNQWVPDLVEMQPLKHWN